MSKKVVIIKSKEKRERERAIECMSHLDEEEREEKTSRGNEPARRGRKYVNCKQSRFIFFLFKRDRKQRKTGGLLWSGVFCILQSHSCILSLLANNGASDKFTHIDFACINRLMRYCKIKSHKSLKENEIICVHFG